MIVSKFEKLVQKCELCFTSIFFNPAWLADRTVGELIEVTALVDEYYSLTEVP